MPRKILEKGKIEKAKPEDIDDILDIERESSPNPWKRSFFEEEFNNKISTILVFRSFENRNIEGFIVFRKIIDIIEINNIAVKRKSRRKGIGWGLLSSLIEIAVGEKMESVFLEVRSQNKRAVQFYEKSGFKFLRIRKGYYNNPGDDALILRLDLN